MLTFFLCFKDCFDPNVTTLDDLLRAQIMIVWEMMNHKETQLNGIVVIVDGSGFSAKQVKVLTPYHVQKYITLTLVRMVFENFICKTKKNMRL